MSSAYNISVHGSVISFLSGAFLGTSLAITAPIDTVGKTKKEWALNILSTITLGGGLMSLGLYLMAPNFVREMWMYKNYWTCGKCGGYSKM